MEGLAKHLPWKDFPKSWSIALALICAVVLVAAIGITNPENISVVWGIFIFGLGILFMLAVISAFIVNIGYQKIEKQLKKSKKPILKQSDVRIARRAINKLSYRSFKEYARLLPRSTEGRRGKK